MDHRIDKLNSKMDDIHPKILHVYTCKIYKQSMCRCTKSIASSLWDLYMVGSIGGACTSISSEAC